MDSRRYLPHALIATAAVIALPALVVVPLAPFDGVPDMLLSALLATGLSVVAGSICSAVWTRRPESREIVFGDLMLWAWARRVRNERRVARDLGDRGEDQLATLHRLNVVFEARDARSHGHSERVARHAERIARQLGLSQEEVAKVKLAASLHDVGKVGLPRAILLEEGSLTEDQGAVVERHVDHGAEKIVAAGAPDVAAIVRHHHERVDGAGYPDGLAGDDIPIGARIVAVADSFDKLACDGPPRTANSQRNVLDALSQRAGTELDAEVVAAFAGYYSGKRAIAGVALAATGPQRLVRWLAATPAAIGTGATPSLVGGVCAAGTLALAGSCLSGLPAASEDSRDGQPASGSAQTANQRTSAAEQRSAAGDPDVAGNRRAARRRRAADTSPGGGRGDVRVPSSGGPRGEPDGDGSPSSPPAAQSPTPVSGGGGSGSEAPTPSRGLPLPPIDVPQTPAPEAPADPVKPLDPVLEGVSQALDPLPPELTAPVERLLDPLAGNGASAP